jgi:DNA-binding NarL/FixJ family response regulator
MPEPALATAERLEHIGPIPDEILTDIGATAFGGYLRSVEEPDSYPDPRLTYRERALVSYLSRGYSLNRTAAQFHAHPDLMAHRLDNIQGKFGVRQTPALVGKIIEKGELVVPAEPNPELTESLTTSELVLLMCLHRGVEYRQIAKKLHRDVKTLKVDTHEAVLKVGAINSTNAVRRAFELDLPGFAIAKS